MGTYLHFDRQPRVYETATQIYVGASPIEETLGTGSGGAIVLGGNVVRDRGRSTAHEILATLEEMTER